METNGVWGALAKSHLLKRIKTFGENEIRFNLMAVKKNQINSITAKINQLENLETKKENVANAILLNKSLLADAIEKRKKWSVI